MRQNSIEITKNSLPKQLNLDMRTDDEVKESIKNKRAKKLLFDEREQEIFDEMLEKQTDEDREERGKLHIGGEQRKKGRRKLYQRH